MLPGIAPSRLLPMSVPFRFFGAAAAFQCVAWLALLLHAEELPGFSGGLGPVFAALHFLTLGVLAMAAIGATLQLLPVATRQPVRAVGAAKALWWILVPGVLAFAGGAAHYRLTLMSAGATAVLVALAVYAALLAANLRNARGMKAIVAHAWAALACLAGLAATGILLVARFEHGLAIDYAAFRGAHVALAAYGFMGLLAAGLSQLLLPMLAIAPPPGRRGANAILAAACAGIAVAALGLPRAGAAIGLAAAAAHVWTMERALQARLRGRLGGAFVLIRASWGCLLASLALAALGLPGGPLLFGALLVPGWLLTFLLGVMQRIVPFLASVHASGPHGAPLVSAMTPSRLLGAHRALHLGALALVLAGIALASPALVALGAGGGLAAALAFLAFFVLVVMKARSHGNPYPPSHPAPA